MSGSKKELEVFRYKRRIPIFDSKRIFALVIRLGFVVIICNYYLRY